MSVDDVDDNEAGIRHYLDDEASRTRHGFGSLQSGPSQMDLTGSARNQQSRGVPDPAGCAERSTVNDLPKSDADYIRRIVPELAHMSDAYLTQHSLDRLQKFVQQSKKALDDRKEKNIEQRLAQNLEHVIKNPVTINHSDNRADVLHPARFLPGAAVPFEKLWTEARKHWGREPAVAVSEFDLLAIGLPGCIPAKAWEILHEPGSREISLKMFTVTNAARASDGVKIVTTQSDEGLVIKESLKELTEMSELKTAFRNLKIAAQIVRPWDYSLLVIESFLISTEYLDAQLTGIKKAPVLSGFLDHLLRVNASNWLQGKPFMDMTSIKSLWDPWWAGHKGDIKKEDGSGAQKGGGGQNNSGGQRGGKFGRQGQGQGQGQNQGFSQGQSGGQAFYMDGQGPSAGRRGRWTPAGNFTYGNFVMPPPDFSGPPSEKTICRRYNEKDCQNTYNTCVMNSKYGPFRLYHLCNYSEMKNGKLEVCAAKHARPDHK
jgi:predicted DNA-binding protein